MDIKDLRYFLAIAREENITKASKILHITQPTLTRQMQTLEAELDRSLFIRTNKKTVLTNEGMAFRNRAEEIVAMMDHFEMEYMDSADSVTGEIRIGAGETDAVDLIAETTKKLQERYPQIKLHIHSGTADDIVAKLNKGVLDFGLLFEPVAKETLEYIDIPHSHKRGLLVRRDHPLAEKKFITVNDLKGLPLILSVRENTSHTSITHLLGIKENELNVVATGTLLYNLSRLVKSGIGCAVGIDHIIEASPSTGLIFVPFETAPEIRIILAWKKYAAFSRAQELFLEDMKQNIQAYYDK